MISIIKEAYEKISDIRNSSVSVEKKARLVRELVHQLDSNQRDYRVVCQVLEPVSKDWLLSEEAISILDYWVLCEEAFKD